MAASGSGMRLLPSIGSYGLSGYQIFLLCQKFFIYKFDILDDWRYAKLIAMRP
jgi:hypothetical protein